MINARVMRMNNEAGCTWNPPKGVKRCDCPVPYYALSMHNRVDFCLALKALEQKEAEDMLRSSSGQETRLSSGEGGFDSPT
jgi:hypothetical protein